VKAYLISWLSRNHQAGDMGAFERTFPGPWLVWEAGPWRPPAPDRATRISSERRARESAGDALALQVSPRPGRTPAQGIRLGRGPDNDLVVDDGTLSRTHLLLCAGEAGWTVQDLRSSNGTRVDGLPVNGAPVPVEPGSVIEAGSVRLTFYDARGLYLRLKHGIG
jgi:hypothetical protein